jgi:hypothetical protein
VIPDPNISGLKDFKYVKVEMKGHNIDPASTTVPPATIAEDIPAIVRFWDLDTGLLTG